MGQLESNVAEGNRASTAQGIGLENSVAGNRVAGQGLQQNLEGSVANNSNQANQLASQMFNTQTGEVSDLGNRLLQSMGLNYKTQDEAIAALTQLSKNPGLFQTALQDVIGLGGMFAGFHP